MFYNIFLDVYQKKDTAMKPNHIQTDNKTRIYVRKRQIDSNP